MVQKKKRSTEETKKYDKMTKLVIKQLFIHEENNKLTHFIGDVINYNGSLGPSVIHGGQTVVTLLSGCVPNLKLYRCVIQAHRLR